MGYESSSLPLLKISVEAVCIVSFIIIRIIVNNFKQSKLIFTKKEKEREK